MFRLITLGRIALTDLQGRPVEAILKQPKRLALLTYLAIAGEGVLRSRDTVMGLFWPDETQARARQSLNQSLYVLRKALGKDLVVSVGNDQIGLAAGSVWCDAVAMRAAEASGDHRSAQSHYRGDFLPGFFLSGAADFEKWLDAERAGLRRLASSSAWKLATESADAGDVEAAAAAAVRSAELALREEAAVRRAIELLDSLGERARALDLYRELEEELAEDLATTPAPETQELIARVRAREPSAEVARAAASPPAARAAPAGTPASSGAAVSAGATALADDASAAGIALAPDAIGAPAGSAGATTLAHGERDARDTRRARWLRAGLVGVPLVVVALVAIWLVTRPSATAVAVTLPEPHLLIEPFEAFEGDARLADLAGAITQGVAAELAQVDALDVLLVDSAGRPGADSAVQAHEAGATSSRAWFVVHGRVQRVGDRMRAVVSLIDRPSGRVIGSATIDRTTTDPIAFIDAATADAVRFTRAAVGRELRERAWRASARDDQAARLLERAEADRLSAILLLRRGATPAAATVLANADSLLALAEARDPLWVPPIVARAQVAYQRMWASLGSDILAARGYVEEGIGHAERALALDTADARALETEGTLLYWSVSLGGASGDVATAALRRAETALRAAVSIDPTRAEAWRTLSAIQYDLGRYDEAYASARNAYAADAFLDQPLDILLKLFLSAFEAGDDQAAAEWCSELQQRFPGDASGPLCRLILLAWVEDPSSAAVAEARGIVAEAAGTVHTHWHPVFDLHYAIVLARAGQAQEAEEVLARVHATAWNPELVPFEAAIRLELGEAAVAAALLRDYVAERPTARGGVLDSRRFAALRQ